MNQDVVLVMDCGAMNVRGIAVTSDGRFLYQRFCI